MTAFGWVRVVQQFLSKKTRPSRRPAAKPRTAIGVERLEGHILLSTVRPLAGALHAHQDVGHIHQSLAHHAVRPSIDVSSIAASILSGVKADAMSAAQTNSMASMTQTITQVLSVPPTLTPVSAALVPPLNLFNPALGTLTSVSISGITAIASQIEAQNTSQESGSHITASVTGSATLSGLTPTPLTAALAETQGPIDVGPDVPPSPIFNPNPPVGHTFNVVQSANFVDQTGNPQIVLTDPASLQFFTAKTGVTQITPTLQATATATATAPDGNLTTLVTTGASAQVTVTYTFTSCPPPPTVTKVTINGVHHQPTTILVQLQGQVNAVQANNVFNYQLSSTGPNAKPIAITSAVFNPVTNTVTLTPDHHLNVHLKYSLTVNLFNLSTCQNGTTQTIIFGTRKDLGPFVNHHGEVFVATPTGPLQFIRIA
ncbi:MAG TPA: choice-of-anchor E domain-containing protein [Isosphaeraceae bacterium]|jgi:hypothetical protein|nr:choice-of-anchor E domain-containing protein [Isosphaeraceae bacterium]